MKSPSEYLQQAAKYDILAAQAIKDRRKVEYERLAQIYRYLAEQAALVDSKAS